MKRSANAILVGLLAALGYSSLDKEGCRIGCDLMGVFLVIDERTDKAADDVAQIKADVQVIMDAIRNPHLPRPPGEWIGGEVVRQFWTNAMAKITPIVQRRFIDTFQAFLDGVVEEGKDRPTHHCRTVESYFEVRRKTVGAKPAFIPIQMDLDIPEHIMRHPVIERLTYLAVDMTFVGNDLFSYNQEQARGDVHNLIMVAMHEFNTDVQTAINWIGNHHESLVHQFLNEWHNIPIVSLGLPENAGKDVQAYCERLAYWIRGNGCWSFESERYFGKAGREIQNTRRVQLLPRVHSTPVKGNIDV